MNDENEVTKLRLDNLEHAAAKSETRYEEILSRLNIIIANQGVTPDKCEGIRNNIHGRINAILISLPPFAISIFVAVFYIVRWAVQNEK